MLRHTPQAAKRSRVGSFVNVQGAYQGQRKQLSPAAHILVSSQTTRKLYNASTRMTVLGVSRPRSIVVTLYFILTSHNHPKASNVRVDAAAQIQSSIAGPVMMRNTLPPLASNDLLGG